MGTLATDVGVLEWPRDNTMHEWVKNHGTWEPHVAAVLRRFLQPGSVFVDVGAHVGYFSVLAAQIVGATGRVYAFEPLPSNYALLRQNVAAYPQVQCYDLAAWDRDMRLYLHPNPDNSGDGSLAPRGDVEGVAVQGARVGDFVRGAAALVKIDVQGAELQALRGLDFLVAKHRPALVIEHAPEHLRRMGTDPDVALAYYRAQGYRHWQELGDVMENRQRGYWDLLLWDEEPQ